VADWSFAQGAGGRAPIAVNKVAVIALFALLEVSIATHRQGLAGVARRLDGAGRRASIAVGKVVIITFLALLEDAVTAAWLLLLDNAGRRASVAVGKVAIITVIAKHGDNGNCAF
jgi:hypothetical protein